MEGKVALVTGGSSGIGEATARLFARQGASVVVSARGRGRGEEVVSDIREHGGEATFVEADVSKVDDVRHLIDETLERFGSLDFAFNNAGMVGELLPLAEYPEDDWSNVIQTNLSGVYYCMKYELKAMLSTGGGAIVNNASILGHRGNPLYGPAYAASKHGVIGLTQVTALQYATQSVRVNAVSPGVIDTPMVAQGTDGDPALLEMLRGWHPMDRLGAPEEVASAVIWLCSDGSGFVTGQAIVIDGGAAANFGFNAKAPNPFG